MYIFQIDSLFIFYYSIIAACLCVPPAARAEVFHVSTLISLMSASLGSIAHVASVFSYLYLTACALFAIACALFRSSHIYQLSHLSRRSDTGIRLERREVAL